MSRSFRLALVLVVRLPGQKDQTGVFRLGPGLGSRMEGPGGGPRGAWNTGSSRWSAQAPGEVEVGGSGDSDFGTYCLGDRGALLDS